MEMHNQNKRCGMNTRVKAAPFLLLILSSIFLLPAGVSAQDSMMRQYQMARVDGVETLQPVLTTVPVPVPAANEVLVRMRAVSLNRKDIYAMDRYRANGDTAPGLSISDGAGTVAAIGENVTNFKVGDRVVGAFDTTWVDGEGSGYNARVGMLSEYVLISEATLLRIPNYMTYLEASTLPCAAVTAWNTLFKSASLQPGEYVLLQGTGGVSIFGLQLAAAAGGQPIITSSSDEKLREAWKLGAAGTVNYRKHPEWQHKVLELTGGIGVKHVLEVGGADTFPKAVASLAVGGHIGSIGGLGEGGFIRQEPVELLEPLNATWTYIYVGSATDFKNLLEFMTEHEIHPVIDRVFPFAEAPAAYDYMVSEGFIGKIVIAIDR